MLRLLTILSLLIICQFGSANIPDHLMDPVVNSRPAKALSLPDISGNIIHLHDYLGSYVLVNFWADWCPPCIEEFPVMQQLYDTMRDQSKHSFEILAVHVGEPSDRMSHFLNANGITFKVVIDHDTGMGKWHIPALPMSYLISPQGYIIYHAVGPRGWQSQAMQQIINESLQ